MDENLAVSLVESREPVHQHVAPLVRESGRLGGRSRVPRDDRTRAQREPRAPPGRPASVSRFVRDDLEQPWPKRATVPEATERAVCLDERVLYGVPCVIGVAGGDKRDAERDPLVHAYELLVGGRVPALRARDDCLLVQWPALHSLPSTPGALPWFR